MLSNLLIELIQKNKKIFFISFKTSIRVKIKSKIKNILCAFIRMFIKKV
jgi:hypothetical protein